MVTDVRIEPAMSGQLMTARSIGALRPIRYFNLKNYDPIVELIQLIHLYNIDYILLLFIRQIPGNL